MSSLPPRHEIRTSGFHCKGVIYVETLRFLDEHTDAGRAAVLDAIEDEDRRAFLGQPFIVGGWYDVIHMEELFRTAARVTGVPYLDLLRRVASWLLPQQIRGIYKFILVFATPDMVMKNLARTARTYFDFVNTEVTAKGPGHYESAGGNVPLAMSSAYMVVTEIALKVILENAGAKGLKQRWLPTEPQGKVRGVDVVCVRRVVSWE